MSLSGSGPGSGSGARRKGHSAARPSGCRLVASTVSFGQASRTVPTSSRDGLEQVLAVVDDEQVRAVAEDRDAGRQDVAAYLAQAQRCGQRVRDARRVGDRCQQQHRRGVGSTRELEREAGLADAARTDDR